MISSSRKARDAIRRGEHTMHNATRDLERLTDGLTAIEQHSWYIRTGLDRAISQTIDKLHDIHSMCTNAVKNDLPLSPYLSLYNFARWHEVQWVTEALDYLGRLPEPIRPVQSRDGWDHDNTKKKLDRAIELLDELKENFS